MGKEEITQLYYDLKQCIENVDLDWLSAQEHNPLVRLEQLLRDTPPDLEEMEYNEIKLSMERWEKFFDYYWHASRVWRQVNEELKESENSVVNHLKQRNLLRSAEDRLRLLLDQLKGLEEVGIPEGLVDKVEARYNQVKLYYQDVTKDFDKQAAYTAAQMGEYLVPLYRWLAEVEEDPRRLNDQVEFYSDHRTKRLEIITVEEALRALARQVQDEWGKKISEYIEQAKEKKLVDPVGALATLERWRELPGYEKFEPPRAPGEVWPGLKDRTVRLSDGTELSFRIYPADMQKIEALEKELKERVARREKARRSLQAARELEDMREAWRHFARALEEDPDVVHDREYESVLQELVTKTREALNRLEGEVRAKWRRGKWSEVGETLAAITTIVELSERWVSELGLSFRSYTERAQAWKKDMDDVVDMFSRIKLTQSMEQREAILREMQVRFGLDVVGEWEEFNLWRERIDAYNDAEGTVQEFEALAEQGADLQTLQEALRRITNVVDNIPPDLQRRLRAAQRVIEAWKVLREAEDVLRADRREQFNEMLESLESVKQDLPSNALERWQRVHDEIEEKFEDLREAERQLEQIDALMDGDYGAQLEAWRLAKEWREKPSAKWKEFRAKEQEIRQMLEDGAEKVISDAMQGDRIDYTRIIQVVDGLREIQSPLADRYFKEYLKAKQEKVRRLIENARQLNTIDAWEKAYLAALDAYESTHRLPSEQALREHIARLVGYCQKKYEMAKALATDPIEELQKLRNQFPRDPEILLSLAKLYYERGQDEYEWIRGV